MGLQYLDILVYTALRDFDNYSDANCFAMHSTIGAKAGLSKRFVIESIKRLEQAKVITVERSKRKNTSNQYYFTAPQRNSRLEKIPKDIFDTVTRVDLTSNELALLLCIRQFFHHGKYTFAGQRPVAFFAEWLGLSKETVRKQFRSLISKGYIDERLMIYKQSEYAPVRYTLTDKIDWNYDMYDVPQNVAADDFVLLVE